MNAALETELIKAGRAPVFRWGALAVVAGAPAMVAVFFLLAGQGADSVAAAKARALITDVSLAGYLTTCGQVLVVALSFSGGIAASWTFGREFVDGTAAGLFAIATPRSRIAAAKVAVLILWGGAIVVATGLVAAAVGWVLGLDRVGTDIWVAMGQLAGGGLLTVFLYLPFALVASWRRGYLPGIVALVLVVVATQLLTTVGVGAWFPYAAPSLMLGMGGDDAARAVTWLQLALPVLLGGASGWAVVRWWAQAQVV